MSLFGLPVIDVRAGLPRAAVQSFPRRRLSSIAGMVVHHVGNDSTPEQAARFHVEDRGWPGLAYHFWVKPDGEVLWTQDLENAVYSQGGEHAESPVPFTEPNRHFLAVVLEGDFSHRDPSDAQATALRWLWVSLRGDLGLRPDMVFAHLDFKATICPGKAAMVAWGLRPEGELTWALMPKSVAGVQRVLVERGHDLGRYGLHGDGIDGRWGPMSSEALRAEVGQTSLSFRSVYALTEKVRGITG